jgi:hypothetical protein
MKNLFLKYAIFNTENSRLINYSNKHVFKSLTIELTQTHTYMKVSIDGVLVAVD